MRYNTAIFYDIENLVKGYNSSQDFINNISLQLILEKVKAIDGVEAIASQKAYANWSDRRLGAMWGEINSLGIDPIQVFGFSRYQKKNAADIQLTVDAIDLAHVRQGLEVFVIVSGDGGFAALAKKLHEYGKTVVGCAYASVTNKIFQAVCDVFIGIEEPTDPEVASAIDNGPDQSLKITNPKVIRLSQEIERLSSQDMQTVLNQSKRVIQWFVNDSESRQEMSRAGIHLSVIREAFKYSVVDFNPAQFGFPKFSEYLQFLCRNTPICVYSCPPTSFKLAIRNVVLPGGVPLPDLPEDYLNSVDHYRNVLGAGYPIFRITEPEAMLSTASLLPKLMAEKHDLAAWLTLLEEQLGEDHSQDAINSSLLGLINAGIFRREPSDSSLAEQTLLLDPQYSSADAILQQVKQVMRAKLVDFLGTINEAHLTKIVPW